MIIHKLISHHLRHGDDAEFYRLQADAAVSWMRRNGVLFLGASALDLGCGGGHFGKALQLQHCNVRFSDDHEIPGIYHRHFQRFRIGHDDPARLGKFDLVVLSNVLEHLPYGVQYKFLGFDATQLLNPGGYLYLSFTPWLSPWGGHDFSPLHYLGPRLGPWIYDRLRPGKRQHFPFAGLWPTFVGQTLRTIQMNPALRTVAVAPRYYDAAEWIMRVPILREFASWNCAVLAQRQ